MPVAGDRRLTVVAGRGHKRWGAVEVLKGTDLTVTPGEVLCLVGQSGPGRTTFLRCISHLEQINGGRLRVDGHLMAYGERELHPRAAARRRRDIGMMSQNVGLLPHETGDQRNRTKASLAEVL